MLRKHNGGPPDIIPSYGVDEKVYTIRNLAEFDEAVREAGELVMAVCFNNGNAMEEGEWDKIKPQYAKVRCYKVNTLNAQDVRDKYADGHAKPYFKFYNHGELIDEVKKTTWKDTQEPELLEKMQKHNGPGVPYSVT